ncbi:hypothetical protein [Adhaeribacter pallidiroseus]|uniref:Immunity protein 63 domain-containing protein n=1 Tax=Adhaeribacter pallidiroseus TaxID=2072847 RepID=A0A369QTN4_9BACT|nr:hypothetical protein [Adhaeribacter pallidiroseus]RDC66179.1 hypothetical protein AHMF7616_04810 [Adhaeribacter pallidiroseus]
MKIEELHKTLQKLGVPGDRYYLHGLYGSTDDDEKYALVIKKGKYTIEYEVYYRERGGKHSILTFTEEDKACEYFFRQVKDSWTQEQIQKIDGFSGMTVNERLYISELMDEFAKCKAVNKTRAVHILRMLQIDEPSIKEIIK